eukprot:206380_1
MLKQEVTKIKTVYPNETYVKYINRGKDLQIKFHVEYKFIVVLAMVVTFTVKVKSKQHKARISVINDTKSSYSIPKHILESMTHHIQSFYYKHTSESVPIYQSIMYCKNLINDNENELTIKLQKFAKTAKEEEDAILTYHQQYKQKQLKVNNIETKHIHNQYPSHSVNYDFRPPQDIKSTNVGIYWHRRNKWKWKNMMTFDIQIFPTGINDTCKEYLGVKFVLEQFTHSSCKIDEMKVHVKISLSNFGKSISVTHVFKKYRNNEIICRQMIKNKGLFRSDVTLHFNIVIKVLEIYDRDRDRVMCDKTGIIVDKHSAQVKSIMKQQQIAKISNKEKLNTNYTMFPKKWCLTTEKRIKEYIKTDIIDEEKQFHNDTCIDNRTHITETNPPKEDVWGQKMNEDVRTNAKIDDKKHDKLATCEELLKLFRVMEGYTDPDTAANEYSEHQIQDILDSFLYLLSIHNSDEDFERISNVMGYCDISKCKILRRLFRDRSVNNAALGPINLSDDILGKIHCYYQHSFALGTRLRFEEKIRLQQNNNITEYECCSVNRMIIETNRILAEKRQKWDYITRFNIRCNNKFAQLSLEEAIDDNNEQIYSFGKRFNYRKGIKDPNEKNNNTNDMRVTGKYSDLKEELLMNEIMVLTMDQFNAAYSKARVHYHSKYRKEYYENINLNCLLALIVYCNFDTLQHLFSKTYREDEHKHQQFYHWGKHLKIAVHGFGYTILKGNKNKLKSIGKGTVDEKKLKIPKKFYHGISEVVTFPAYVNKVSIRCPLSTSTSYEVAFNFTNDGNGLILEFGDFDAYSASSPKYFSANWLSDFTAESECLFIQNSDNHKLSINEITDAQFGYAYGDILVVMKIIDIAFGFHMHKYVTNANKKKLVERIVEHQLSIKHDSYNEFLSLSEYARKMISGYCKTKTSMTINATSEEIKQHLFLDTIFQFSGLVQISLVKCLFPNVKNVRLTNVKSSNIDGIIKAMVESSCLKSVDCISIHSVDRINNVVAVIHKYTWSYALAKYNLVIYGNYQYIHVERRGEISFAMFMVRNMGQWYFEETRNILQNYKMLWNDENKVNSEWLRVFKSLDDRVERSHFVKISEYPKFVNEDLFPFRVYFRQNKNLSQKMSYKIRHGKVNHQLKLICKSHDYGSVIPLIFKDTMKLQLKLDSNVIDDEHWCRSMQPHLQRICKDIKSTKLFIALLFIGILNGTDKNCESVMEPHKDERKSADDYQIVKPIEVAFSLYDPELFLAIMFRNTDKIMDINGNPLIDIQYKIYKLWFNEYNKSKLNVIKLHGNDCSVDIFAEALRYLYYTPKTPILYERCWNLKSTIANIIETTFNNIQMIFDNELSPKAIREERDMITRMFSDAQSKNLKAAKIKRIKANSIPFISFYADQKIIVNWNSMNSCRKTGVSTNIFLDNMMSIFPALKVIDIVNISTNHLGVILRSILLFANHNSEKCLRRIRIHNGDISDNLVVRYTRKFADETNWILENDIILTLRKPNYVMNGDINQHLCRVLLAPTAGIYMPVIQEWKDIKLDMRIFPNGVTDVYNKYIGLRIIGWKFAKHIQKIQFHCKISLKEYDECASGTFTLSEGDECRFDTFVLKNNVRFLNQLTFKAEITVTELYNVN